LRKLTTFALNQMPKKVQVDEEKLIIGGDTTLITETQEDGDPTSITETQEDGDTTIICETQESVSNHFCLFCCSYLVRSTIVN